VVGVGDIDGIVVRVEVIVGIDVSAMAEDES
jgi:hypothetical protein